MFNGDVLNCLCDRDATLSFCFSFFCVAGNFQEILFFNFAFHGLYLIFD